MWAYVLKLCICKTDVSLTTQPIVDVRVLNGFGFVEFDDPRDADYAVRDFDGTMFMGDRIIVQPAKQPLRRDRDRERDPYGPPRRPRGFDMRGPRGPRGPRRGMYRLIVFNLPPGTSWQDLKDVGREHGHVTFSDINPNQPDEGALEFESRDDYERALARIEGTDLRGAILRAEPDGDLPPLPPPSSSERRERSPVGRYRDDYRDERPPPPMRDVGLDDRYDSRDRWNARNDDRYERRGGYRDDERYMSRYDRRVDERSDRRFDERDDGRYERRDDDRADGPVDERDGDRYERREDDRADRRFDERDGDRYERRDDGRADGPVDERDGDRYERRDDDRVDGPVNKLGNDRHEPSRDATGDLRNDAYQEDGSDKRGNETDHRRDEERCETNHDGDNHRDRIGSSVPADSAEPRPEETHTGSKTTDEQHPLQEGPAQTPAKDAAAPPPPSDVHGDAAPHA